MSAHPNHADPFLAPPPAHPQVQAFGAPLAARPPFSDAAWIGFMLTFLFAPAGLVVSIIGIAHTQGGRRRGLGLAVTGAVLSGFACLIAIFALLFAVLPVLVA